MIEIRTTMSASPAGGYCRMSVTGHAGAAPFGADLACAAVSALVQTLYYWILDKNEKRQMEASLHMEAGYVFIEAEAKTGQMKQMLDGFEVICFGLENLARQYPEYITYKSGACRKESKT